MLTVYGEKMQETLRLFKRQNNQLQQLISCREDVKEMFVKQKNARNILTTKQLNLQ
jgi:hypothetical protein